MFSGLISGLKMVLILGSPREHLLSGSALQTRSVTRKLMRGQSPDHFSGTERKSRLTGISLTWSIIQKTCAVLSITMRFRRPARKGLLLESWQDEL